MNDRAFHASADAAPCQKARAALGEVRRQASRTGRTHVESAEARKGLGQAAIMFGDQQRQPEEIGPVLPFGGHVAIIGRLVENDIEIAILMCQANPQDGALRRVADIQGDALIERRGEHEPHPDAGDQTLDGDFIRRQLDAPHSAVRSEVGTLDDDGNGGRAGPVAPVRRGEGKNLARRMTPHDRTCLTPCGTLWFRHEQHGSIVAPGSLIIEVKPSFLRLSRLRFSRYAYEYLIDDSERTVTLSERMR